MPKYKPESVWIREKLKGFPEYTVTKKDGKTVHYDCYSLPLCVWESMKNGDCPVYYGPDKERLHVVEKD